MVPWRSSVPQCQHLERGADAISPEPFHVVELDHRVFRETNFQVRASMMENYVYDKIAGETDGQTDTQTKLGGTVS